MKKIITIGREFGSGGRELGVRLSQELGIKYYDKEILQKMAADTAFSEEYISRTVETRQSRLLPITIGHSISVSNDYQIMQMQEIYRAQTKTIRELAEEGDCVIIGRCADYILRDIKPCRIFVHADIESRVQRCMERRTEEEMKMKESEMRRHILSIDKERAGYYNDFTFQKWGDRKNYDLCINTTEMSVRDIAKGLARFFD